MVIESDRHFQDLIISRNLRKSSIKEYAKSLNQYCVFINKNPTELIEEAENQEDQQIRMKNRNVKRYILDYYKHLKDKNLRYNTIKKQLAIIKTFYHEYDIETPRFKLVEDEIPETVYSTDLPGHDEIKIILNNCNKKYQAIICTMASSGMGRAEIQHLKIKDFFLAINYKGNVEGINSILDNKDINHVALWKVFRIKTNMPYVTFSSPESIKLIVEYLQASERRNIKIEDPLFTSIGKRALTNPAFEGMFTTINRRCGFGKTGYHHYFSSHKLRKFFATTLTIHQVPKIYVDWMLGHKINRVDDSYFKIDIEALRNEYLRILPYLMFKEKVEVHSIKSPEFKKVAEELDKKELRIQRLERYIEEKEGIQQIKKPK